MTVHVGMEFNGRKKKGKEGKKKHFEITRKEYKSSKLNRTSVLVVDVYLEANTGSLKTASYGGEKRKIGENKSSASRPLRQQNKVELHKAKLNDHYYELLFLGTESACFLSVVFKSLPVLPAALSVSLNCGINNT